MFIYASMPRRLVLYYKVFTLTWVYVTFGTVCNVEENCIKRSLYFLLHTQIGVVSEPLGL